MLILQRKFHVKCLILTILHYLFQFFCPLCRTICVLLERNRGYVPIYVPNCIAISSYHQCLKFMIFYGANIICFHFASSLPLSFFPFSHFCMAFLTKKKLENKKKISFFICFHSCTTIIVYHISNMTSGHPLDNIVFKCFFVEKDLFVA